MNGLALAFAWPCAVLVWLEELLHSGRDECFGFFANVFALCPGLPGMYLRRAFYRWTLQGCAPDVFIGFGTIFSSREAVLESGVYIGVYAVIGSVILRKNCLIGTRASLLSGPRLHALSENGDWLPTNLALREQVVIGENAWLGEGVVVMANVGARAMLSAAAVSSTPVPEGVMVAGNPARFVKRLAVEGGDNSGAEPASIERSEPVAILG